MNCRYAPQPFKKFNSSENFTNFLKIFQGLSNQKSSQIIIIKKMVSITY